jgi:hypothetical protein
MAFLAMVSVKAGKDMPAFLFFRDTIFFRAFYAFLIIPS